MFKVSATTWQDLRVLLLFLFKLRKELAGLERDIHMAFSEKALCAKHCRRWTYSTTASLAYLQYADENQADDIMDSTIHVYYADLVSRQYQQDPETPVYLAF